MYFLLELYTIHILIRFHTLNWRFDKISPSSVLASYNSTIRCEIESFAYSHISSNDYDGFSYFFHEKLHENDSYLLQLSVLWGTCAVGAGVLAIDQGRGVKRMGLVYEPRGVSRTGEGDSQLKHHYHIYLYIHKCQYRITQIVLLNKIVHKFDSYSINT